MTKQYPPLPLSRTVGMRGIGNLPVEGVQDASGSTVANCGSSGEHLANFIIKACNAHADLIAVLRDVAALLPAAARLHPDDLFKLQTRVCAALAKAGA